MRRKKVIKSFSFVFFLFLLLLLLFSFSPFSIFPVLSLSLPFLSPTTAVGTGHPSYFSLHVSLSLTFISLHQHQKQNQILNGEEEGDRRIHVSIAIKFFFFFFPNFISWILGEVSFLITPFLSFPCVWLSVGYFFSLFFLIVDRIRSIWFSD